jgi:hypothetical protein
LPDGESEIFLSEGLDRLLLICPSGGLVIPADVNRLCVQQPGNYLHRLDDIEKNHEAFANEGVLDASIAVLLKNEGDGCSICG